MNFWTQFPAKDELLKVSLNGGFEQIPHVNAHVHTPYSFSAFKTIDQALEMANREEVKILGINDFYSTHGYNEWAEKCNEHKVFPMFNIEFIGVSAAEQKNGICINDPSNAGRIYVSGKGLAYPVALDEANTRKVEKLISNTNQRVKSMCDKLNKHLEEVGVGMFISFNEILAEHTKGLARERHIAKILRLKIDYKWGFGEEARRIYQKIFGGKELQSNINDHAAVENEIRSKLLKAGGVAFIPLDSKAFLDLESIRNIILASGGIPTYPLLADSVKGGYTQFEEDKESLWETLVQKGIYSVEFIPGRNSSKALEAYASFFAEKNFVVTFGSEHNSPDLIPLRLTDKDGKALSNALKSINFEGACLVAAHQYLKARGEEGYLDKNGMPHFDSIDDFKALGKKILKYYYSEIN